jgi:DNA-binding response OmpR family regulator
VTIARTATAALELAREVDPDVVLLDIMLPDGSGFDVCRELRRDSQVPIIMVTARGEEADRIVGLELGADDYVTKPFSAREVAARIRAVLRRAETPPPDTQAEQQFELGELRVDVSRRLASLAGRPLELARKEFDVLALLAGEAGRVVTRERLLEEVWDTTWFGSTKTLDVHVSALRRKLGDDPAAPRYLHTVRGVGFRLTAPEEAT